MTTPGNKFLKFKNLKKFFSIKLAQSVFSAWLGTVKIGLGRAARMSAPDLKWHIVGIPIGTHYFAEPPLLDISARQSLTSLIGVRRVTPLQPPKICYEAKPIIWPNLSLCQTSHLAETITWLNSSLGRNSRKQVIPNLFFSSNNRLDQKLEF